MPNHCCMVLESAAGYVMGPGCTEQNRKTVDTTMTAIALSVQTRKEDLDAVTGIAGSSPTFIYMLARGLVEAGKKYDLTEKRAVKLAAQSPVGTGHNALVRYGHRRPHRRSLLPRWHHDRRVQGPGRKGSRKHRHQMRRCHRGTFCGYGQAVIRDRLSACGASCS